MHWFTFRSLEHSYFYLFIYFQFLWRCFKYANSSAIIQNPMEKPVGFLSREPRSTLTSGLANIRHPSTTLYCKNTCSSWMIMHESIHAIHDNYFGHGGSRSVLEHFCTSGNSAGLPGPACKKRPAHIPFKIHPKCPRSSPNKKDIPPWPTFWK